MATHPADRGSKPLPGLRWQPGRLALAVFRLPLLLYRRGWGWLLGDTFLLQIQIGRQSFTPQQRFLSQDESLAVLAGFRHRHRHRSRLLASVLNWGDLGSDAAAREFVSTRPFVSLRPIDSDHQRTGGEDHE